MSQIMNMSDIEQNILECSCSEPHNLFQQETFSNYLEPSANDVFDTRRFALKHRNSEVIKTATPKMARNSSSIGRKISGRSNSAKLISNSLYKLPSENRSSHGKLAKKVENLEKKEEL